MGWLDKLLGREPKESEPAPTGDAPTPPVGTQIDSSPPAAETPAPAKREETPPPA